MVKAMSQKMARLGGVPPFLTNAFRAFRARASSSARSEKWGVVFPMQRLKLAEREEEGPSRTGTLRARETGERDGARSLP